MTYPPLDITAQWGRLNDGIIRLVDYVPEDMLDWSPKPELWNFRGILAHIATARHTWMTRDAQDGETSPDVVTDVKTREGIKHHLRTSWQRMEQFLADPAKLSATYQSKYEPYEITGHWIAFHGLEHDIHHRADILHYLALLGIEHPEVTTP
jgi:uncharacterized damage-inducible protein DinB